MTRKLLLILVIIGAGIIISPVFAMESTNYRVSPDVIDEGGGIGSDGTYRIYNNIGESAVTGDVSSINYRIWQGFLQPDMSTIYMTISNPTINFGKLRFDTVSTGSTVVTIGSNSNNGYSLRAYDNTSVGIANGLIEGANKIADATTPNTFINFPLAGTEHYGITVTGTHADSGYAAGTKINSLDDSTWINVGSYTHVTKNDSYTIEYRTSISEDTNISQNYQAITTYILTVNY